LIFAQADELVAGRAVQPGWHRGFIISGAAAAGAIWLIGQQMGKAGPTHGQTTVRAGGAGRVKLAAAVGASHNPHRHFPGQKGMHHPQRIPLANRVVAAALATHKLIHP
jgi:hypothetical protein